MLVDTPPASEETDRKGVGNELRPRTPCRGAHNHTVTAVERSSTAGHN